MAEYLDPRDGYALVTLPDWKAPEPWLIEVPDGAEALTKNGIELLFWKDASQCYDPKSRFTEWYDGDLDLKEWLSMTGSDLAWQRPTQPEELPFIDDEPIRVVEPPAYFGNAIRLKPRIRMYATIVHKVEINVVLPMPPQKITLNFLVGA